MFHGISETQNAVFEIGKLEEEHLPVFVLQREIVKETQQELIIDITIEGDNSFRTDVADITSHLHSYGGMIDKVHFHKIILDKNAKSLRFILHPIDAENPFAPYDDLSIVFDKNYFTTPMDRNREAPVIYLQDIEGS